MAEADISSGKGTVLCMPPLGPVLTLVVTCNLICCIDISHTQATIIAFVLYVCFGVTDSKVRSTNMIVMVMKEKENGEGDTPPDSQSGSPSFLALAQSLF